MKDAALLMAFIEVESAGNPRAFRNDRNGGSYGWMQLDLRTAEDRGYKGNAVGLYNIRTNVQFAAAVLDWIAENLNKHGLYSVANLAAAYNSGLEHVLGGGVDTDYSDEIVASYAAYQAILK